MTAPLVEVQGLAKVFDVSPPWLNRVVERKPKALVHAVDGVSFAIERGRTLALVGESGCGKSTVARLLVGLYRATQGQVRFDGEDIVKTLAGSSAPALRRRMQMIFRVSGFECVFGPTGPDRPALPKPDFAVASPAADTL